MPVRPGPGKFPARFPFAPKRAAHLRRPQPAGQSMWRPSRAREGPLPLSWRLVDGPEDRSRPRAHRRRPAPSMERLPKVERISIDEAFADVAGCTHLFGSPPEIARVVRRRVRAELGLPISIGVARTKHLAKIASQVAKPDGLVVVHPESELDFLHDLPVELMWGVGPVTRARLAEIGVHTIGQLAKMPGYSLERLLGRAAGAKLTALAWNRDPREIRTHHRAQSAGAQSALGKKPAEEQVFRPTLRHLADRVASRLRAKSRPGRTVTVRVRFADLHSVTRSVTLDAPISATATLAEIAEELLQFLSP
jgi:DNA polymerase-4